MRIGQLARATGVSADTIRYYEKIGLLPPARRTDNGYREFPEATRNRIRVIRNAVQLGFPLVEVAKALRVRDAGGAPCRQVRNYARDLVRQIEQRIRALSTQRRMMIALISEWDTKLAQARPDDRVHLLEHVAPTVRSSHPKRMRFRRDR